MNYYKEMSLPLLNDGYIPTPVRGKGEGLIPGWASVEYDDFFVKKLIRDKGDHSVGILCGRGDFPIAAVDVDIYDPKISEIISEELTKRFGVAPVRIGKNPKKLFVYLADREFTKIKTSFIDESKITQTVEVLGNGQQFVAFGIHKDTQRPYEWPEESILDIPSAFLPDINVDDLIEWMANELPKIVPDGWELKSQSYSQHLFNDDNDDFTLSVPKPSTDFTRDQVIEMLSIQSPDCDNDEWVRVGMALKHWDEKEGLVIWEEWSKPGKSYQKGETLKRWKSFKATPNQITLATYWKLYRNFLSSQSEELTEHLSDKIKAAETLDQLKELSKTIAFSKIDPLMSITIIDDYRKQFKTITGSILSKGDAQKIIKEARKFVSKDNTDPTDQTLIVRPEWLDDWVFVSSRDKFFRINSSEWLSTLGFNMKFTRFIPLDENGGRKPASRSASEDFLIPVVEESIYHPAEGSIFEFAGRQCVNTFNINSLPPESLFVSDEAREACSMIEQHLLLMCSGREDVARTFLDWLAFNVQNMGVKINYSVLLQGIEGVGKSFVKEMMNRVLGPNASEVSPQVIIGNFNNWAEGSSFLTFEELRIIGHNRHDVVSNIKPLISNKFVSIHKKGQSVYTTPNVTNYLALTNYKDALPLESTDRRWFVIFAPWSSIAEFEADVKESAKDYFGKLFSYLDDYGSEIRRWLLDYKISPDFNNQGRAPVTDERSAMINTAHGNDDTDAIRSIIKKGGIGFNDEIVSVRHLREAVHTTNTSEDFDGGHHQIGIAVLRNLLKEMGFTKFNELNFDRKTTTVWVKHPIRMTNEKARQLLEKTFDHDNPFA